MNHWTNIEPSYYINQRQIDDAISELFFKENFPIGSADILYLWRIRGFFHG